MLGQPEDASVVEPQAFPYGVAALHDGIKRTHPGLAAVDELAVDVDLEVAIPFVVLLQHGQAVMR